MFFTETQQNPSEDRINIYDDDPAKGNFQTNEDKVNAKDTSTYHCVGPSASKEDSVMGGAKTHQYQEINSLHLRDRYEVHQPDSMGRPTITTATAYETPIARKVRVSNQYTHYGVDIMTIIIRKGTHSGVASPSDDVFDGAGSYVPTAVSLLKLYNP